MADNYLERKMEDFRAGVRPKYAPKLTPAGRRPGYLTTPFHPRNILIIGNADWIHRQLTKSLVDAGCKVAVMSADTKEGSSLAQASGALYYPGNPGEVRNVELAIAGLTERWGELSTLIIIKELENEIAALAKKYAELLIVNVGGHPVNEPKVENIAVDLGTAPRRGLYFTLATLLCYGTGSD